MIWIILMVLAQVHQPSPEPDESEPPTLESPGPMDPEDNPPDAEPEESFLASNLPIMISGTN